MSDPYFPPIEPCESGFLDVGQGHRVYWESSGNPAGIPVLFLHGGPGSGCSENQRRLFDPRRFRAVLFDQRASGRSRPLDDGSEEALAANTTDHLIADIEALREHLEIERWAVMGLSWGSTLGLAYALDYRQRVSSVILGLVTTTSRREVDWITEGVGMVFPREWDRFASAVPPDYRRERLVDAFAAMLASPDEELRRLAAREWCLWEDAHVSLAPGARPSPMFDDAGFRFRFARLVTHYWRHHAFRGPTELIDRVGELSGVPGTLIHGRFDVSSPLATAYEMHRRWKTSSLHVVEEGGHGTGAGFPNALLAALDGVAARTTP